MFYSPAGLKPPLGERSLSVSSVPARVGRADGNRKGLAVPTRPLGRLALKRLLAEQPPDLLPSSQDSTCSSCSFLPATEAPLFCCPEQFVSWQSPPSSLAQPRHPPPATKEDVTPSFTVAQASARTAASSWESGPGRVPKRTGKLAEPPGIHTASYSPRWIPTALEKRSAAQKVPPGTRDRHCHPQPRHQLCQLAFPNDSALPKANVSSPTISIMTQRDLYHKDSFFTLFHPQILEK